MLVMHLAPMTPMVLLRGTNGEWSTLRINGENGANSIPLAISIGTNAYHP